MNIERVLQDIKKAMLVGHPPGNPNYKLMALVADLVEGIGEHGSEALPIINDQIWFLIFKLSHAVYYRRVELMRGARVDIRRRILNLEAGIELMGINFKPVLNFTPKATATPGLMLA